MLKDVGITDVNEMLAPPPGRRAGYAWEPADRHLGLAWPGYPGAAAERITAR